MKREQAKKKTTRKFKPEKNEIRRLEKKKRKGSFREREREREIEKEARRTKSGETNLNT